VSRDVSEVPSLTLGRTNSFIPSLTLGRTDSFITSREVVRPLPRSKSAILPSDAVGAALIALWSYSFKEKEEVAWSEFKTMLTTHFMAATHVYSRPLEERDLVRIKSRLEQGGVEHEVSKEAFVQFWPWFRDFEFAILLMRAEWCRDHPRLVEGLISSHQAERILQGSPKGTFLLRISENTPGAVAAAFVEEEDAKLVVRHTLIHTRGKKFVISASGSALHDTSYQYSTLSAAILHCPVLVTLYPRTRKEVAFGVRPSTHISSLSSGSPKQECLCSKKS